MDKEEINLFFDIVPNEKVIYLYLENGSGVRYQYKDIDDIGEQIKKYLNNYYRNKV